MTTREGEDRHPSSGIEDLQGLEWIGKGVWAGKPRWH